MKRTLITPDLSLYPRAFHSLLGGGAVYDSSCSPEARVVFIDRDGGYYLKSAPRGTLEKEAHMTRYFHQKGLGTAVLDYVCADRDYLLSARMAGEDCTHADVLAHPEWLCDMMGERLRALHELEADGCPVADHTANYLATVERNYRTGNYDTSAFPDSFGYASAQEAWRVVEENGHRLGRDTLLHGDFCLPNIMVLPRERRFVGYIDLGNGGVGDRHVDLFWGAWTLNFNLHTERYRDRFFDAYGREAIELDMLDVVAACEVFG